MNTYCTIAFAALAGFAAASLFVSSTRTLTRKSRRRRFRLRPDQDEARGRAARGERRRPAWQPARPREMGRAGAVRHLLRHLDGNAASGAGRIRGGQHETVLISFFRSSADTHKNPRRDERGNDQQQRPETARQLLRQLAGRDEERHERPGQRCHRSQCRRWLRERRRRKRTRRPRRGWRRRQSTCQRMDPSCPSFPLLRRLLLILPLLFARPRLRLLRMITRIDAAGFVACRRAARHRASLAYTQFAPGPSICMVIMHQEWIVCAGAASGVTDQHGEGQCRQRQPPARHRRMLLACGHVRGSKRAD